MNIPVDFVVVVVVVVIGRFRFQQFFSNPISLLRSTSRLPELSEHHVLSSVTENQWQGENNLYESM